MMPESGLIKESNTTTVVHVLNDYKVVINKNKIKDMKIGDRFQIYELTKEITDPISKESLGQLKVSKGTGIVVEVQDTMAIVLSDRENLRSAAFNIAIGGQKELMEFNNPKVGDMAERIRRAT
jgi:hypothetical protein